jgi:hypothetical protein
MAISSKTFRTMDRGTVYGVPYEYSMARDEYILPDGSVHHNQNELMDYVQRNLKSFSGMMDAKLGSRRMTPDDLNARRLFIVTENKKRQLKWDKEFNRKVLELVRQAIEQGGCNFRVAKMVPFKVNSITGVSDTMVQPSYETYTVSYDAWLPESMAYTRCREQAEDAVRHAMPPPDLLPMV